MAKKISTIAVIYLLIGLAFAFIYAWYYHWEPFSYFSLGFYTVIFTWPIQAPGFYWDIRSYGLAGKPI